MNRARQVVMTTRMKYSLPMRIVHWVMAVLILGVFGLGLSLDDLEDCAEKLDLIEVHKAFGVTIFGLLVVRLLVRFRSRRPELPLGLKRWERAAARIGHVLLYLGMLCVPVLGYLGASAAPAFDGQWFFGLYLPDVMVKSEAFSEALVELHGLLAFTFITVVLVHIAGALKHRFFDRRENDVLNRML